MKKHWTHFLPEAGKAILHLADQQITIQERIKELKLQVADWEAEYEENEQELRDLAIMNWSPQEIKAAKLKAKVKPKTK